MERAVRAGLPWVHLRDHEAPDEDVHAAALDWAPELQAMGARVSINTHWKLAREVEALGVHLGHRGPTPREVRREMPDCLIGYSAHEVADLEHEGADYFFLSPVFPTTSKPGAEGLGLDAFQRLAGQAGRPPVYALGGITPERALQCVERGAHGVVVLSGILGADDPAEATKRYLDSLRTVTQTRR